MVRVPLQAVWRKARQVAGDPVLRRWLYGRAIGRHRPHSLGKSGHPPYLRSIAADGAPGVLAAAGERPIVRPVAPLVMQLPGVKLRIEPRDADTLFGRRFDDIETELGLHRFSWVSLRSAEDADWVWFLWDHWSRQRGQPDQSWAWHPYTAAERAINILDEVRYQGWSLMSGLVAHLAAHATAIAARLEYYGDHNTGNHLSNNGRGLLRIGLAIDWPQCAELGATILINEAERIFLPSGVLREGSTHYHLLITRNYVDCWLAARRHRHWSASELEAISYRALRAISGLVLPGGMPLVGDISPDCPPVHLAGLLPERRSCSGWVDRLGDDSRADLGELQSHAWAETAKVDIRPSLVRDGWLRFDRGPWHGLWHVSPGGWTPMPGHGHQDAGSFELHWNDVPLFIDPGRGTYGESGLAALFRSARVHNSLTVDGLDPYPPNRPYYDEDFRRREGGQPPRLEAGAGGVHVAFAGYSRRGVPWVHRYWHFADDAFHLVDRVEGARSAHIVRLFQTEWPVCRDGETAIIKTPGPTFRLVADGAMTIAPSTRWTAYGTGKGAMRIEISARARLPWTGRIDVQLVSA